MSTQGAEVHQRSWLATECGPAEQRGKLVSFQALLELWSFQRELRTAEAATLQEEQAEISLPLCFLCFGLFCLFWASGPIIQDPLSRNTTKSSHGLHVQFCYANLLIITGFVHHSI